MRISQEESADYGMGAVPEAMGVSEAFLDFQARLAKVAQVDRPVLIVGERGAGKELAAARLHYLSGRWERPLVALNCAALAESVLESELFGHEAGAFTGATRLRAGRFETAQGGTLFLDEIGLVSMTVQEKILRAVEYGVFQRVGGSTSVKVDVRIVGATNADLPALAREGRFKRDLLDRLSFDVLFVPPLRARVEDIAHLARHFAAGMARELGMAEAPEFTASALRSLESYPWPGNVRELKNVVERSVYRSGGSRIERIEFDPFANPYARQEGAELPAAEAEAADTLLSRPLAAQTRDLEIRCLKRALLECRHRQSEAAQALGLTYHQFRGLYRKYREELGGPDGLAG